jgi:cytochrome d ubiquinol oxidase subunit II
MHLYDLPLIAVLIGLALYTVLGGADFGAGFWQLVAGSGESGRRLRDHAHESMAPVWEANHVWLIFVLTVAWTAYPTVFGSVASTLAVPLALAGIGIILRGAAYALRAGSASRRELRSIDTVFAVSCLLTPFALGAMVGAIASGRVPVGNARGEEFSSWLSPTGIALGVLAVATSSYLAAVFLAADAVRRREQPLDERFRTLALASGATAGLIAAAGIVVLHGDAHHLYSRLLSGRAIAGPLLSAVAGLATLELVRRRRYEAARYTAALAVAAIIAGWALAQSPVLLPGLTVRQAAAPHDTQVALLTAILAGALVLFPSLALLFRLFLGGRLEIGAPSAGAAGGSPAGQPAARSARPRLLAAAASPGVLQRVAGAGLVTGIGMLTVAEAGWAHAIGVTGLLVFMVAGFFALVPPQLAALARPEHTPGRGSD